MHKIEFRISFKLQHHFLIKRDNVRSVYYGTKTASFISPKIWDILPKGYKNTTSSKRESLKLDS